MELLIWRKFRQLLTLITQVQILISILCGISIYLSSNQNSAQCFSPKGNSSSWQAPFPFPCYHPSPGSLMMIFDTSPPSPWKWVRGDICSLSHVSPVRPVWGFSVLVPRGEPGPEQRCCLVQILLTKAKEIFWNDKQCRQWSFFLVEIIV